MNNQFAQMTNEELETAHKKIKNEIYEVVGSIFGVLSMAQINRRDAIEAEMVKRGMLEAEDE